MNSCRTFLPESKIIRTIYNPVHSIILTGRKTQRKSQRRNNGGWNNRNNENRPGREGGDQGQRKMNYRLPYGEMMRKNIWDQPVIGGIRMNQDIKQDQKKELNFDQLDSVTGGQDGKLEIRCCCGAVFETVSALMRHQSLCPGQR